MIQNSCDATNSKVLSTRTILDLLIVLFGQQGGLVKPKDYQGEHIVGAGESTHMMLRELNLLAGLS